MLAFVRLPGGIVFLCMLLGSSVSTADPVYKYEDRGMVTYGDRAPDPQQGVGHSVLNTQGVRLRDVLSREERLEARKQERELEMARTRDRTLLATFTTEQDLLQTRDGRVEMIDGLISRLDDRLRILSERLRVVNQRVQMQEESMGAGNAQDTLYAEQINLRRNIDNVWSLIDTRTTERREVIDRFTDDLHRYRELKAARY